MDGSLPPHLNLQIPDLTERLMDRLRDDSHGAVAPILNRVVAPPLPIPHVPPLLAPTDRSHIQGYCVNIARVNKSIPRGAPIPNITEARRGKSSVRRPKFEGTCDACGKWGHQVVDCDALGMAICLRKYLPDRFNSRAIQEREESWTEKNKKWVSTELPPRKLLTRYCESVGLSIDQVDDELDWDLLYSSQEDLPSDGDVDFTTPLCNRVVEPDADVVEWFNLSPSSSAWFPQSFRVGLSPIVPPGSTMDYVSPSHEDLTGELHDPALQSVDDDGSVDSTRDGNEDLPDPATTLPDCSDALISRYTLLASLATDIQPVDIMNAFEWSPADRDESLGLGASGTMPEWEDVLEEELLRVRHSVRQASLGAPDISQSLVVPACDDIVAMSFSCSSRYPGLILVDSGSNVCLTNNLSILDDVQDMQPRALDVAVDQSPSSLPRPESMCTKFGFISIQLMDGSVHRQKFLYNESASDTILSPEDIIHSSTVLRHWIQSGSGGSIGDGCLLFSKMDETTILLSLALVKHNGLYYCALPRCRSSGVSSLHDIDGDNGPCDDHGGFGVTSSIRVNTVSRPVTATEHLTSELWAARLGYCGTHQLALISSSTTGTPPKFRCHPF